MSGERPTVEWGGASERNDKAEATVGHRRFQLAEKYHGGGDECSGNHSKQRLLRAPGRRMGRSLSKKRRTGGHHAHHYWQRDESISMLIRVEIGMQTTCKDDGVWNVKLDTLL
ncbi:hypothetical protein GCK72_025110 [Caenorhabditis remanei]|uniref:Uncharacterized protein n=1 Tax=Caenorhabditis remanei TaxID=31234 RepID=A0A6A5G1H1_CAERE|nr:hypothetical protein GCK72_025110 [Caenorhabditis remanei]KAF1748643.1 hypothetical protein GCK72_025110 [Caenorhabditis remanei]